ncbi:MAG: putative bifunctional diguanylate cyclase/phosphodiesterase [Gammaproteobacteria bacterium]
MKPSLEQLNTCVWIYDIDLHQIHWASPSALAFWESESLAELTSRDFGATTSDALRETLVAFRQSFDHDYTLSHNWQFSPKGIKKHAFCHLSGMTLEDGRMAMLVEALPIEKQSYDSQIELTVMSSDYTGDGQFISGNPPFVEEMGSEVHALQDIFVDQTVFNTIHRSLVLSGRYENDVLLKSAQGERWYQIIATSLRRRKQRPETSRPGKILLRQYAIHRRKTNEIALAREALTDSLTGLLNRRGLDKELEKLEREKTPYVLYYIDLDGFKLVNDSFGHGAGDQVLQTVSDRLLACLPEYSAICRFGGDEFVAVVALEAMADGREALADTLIEALSHTYENEFVQRVTVSASIGAAQYPLDAQTAEDIVLCADAAMYQAKNLGKRRLVNYRSGIERGLRRKSSIAQQLSQAHVKKELSLHYQPIWEFSGGAQAESGQKIVSFEALLRWENSELGWVPPNELVRVAEETGMIDSIECWVAQQALTDLSVLRECIAPDVSMAINISPVHLLEPTLPEFILALLQEKNLTPADFSIELTEHALLEDFANRHNAVRRIAEQGVKIYIDDFGTGYSSLAYLHHIPATTVKIDRSFVENLEHNQTTLLHIRRLIEANNMSVLIEGVETEAQRLTLLELGIHLHQGYLLGRPQPLAYYLGSSAGLQVGA